MTLREAPLAATARKLYADNTNDGLFKLAASWPGADEEIPEGMSEVCRFASIRAWQDGRKTEAALYRARSLAAAVLNRERETAAGLLLKDFFQSVVVAVEDRTVKGFEHARAILEEIKRLVPEANEAWGRWLGRLYYDKRAFTYLMEGTADVAGANNRRLLEQAVAAYEDALALAGSESSRDSLKVKGGLILCRHFLGQLAAGAASQQTEKIRELADGRGYNDVANWARANVEAFGDSETTGWVPYEVL